MKATRKLPTVSVVIPTLNSQRTIRQCLDSIAGQAYKPKLEIIVADGGSSDSTVEVARAVGAKIVKNKLKTGEAGKAVGAKAVKGEILAFIDSDNVLPDKTWLSRMVEPFLADEDIIAAEPLFFTYRRQDHWLTRYFALLGMGDPLNLFIGNYDRYSFISGRWTELSIKTQNKKRWLVLDLTANNMPTIGANGFFIRRKQLNEYPVKDYLFDIDVLKFLASDSPVRVAKVEVGIIHLFSGNISTFVRKQRRRIRDFLYFYKAGVRAKEENKLRIFLGVVNFILATCLVVPVVFQAVVGYFRKRDPAWFFHPVACWLTLGAYSVEVIFFFFVQAQFDRGKWSQ